MLAINTLTTMGASLKAKKFAVAALFAALPLSSLAQNKTAEPIGSNALAPALHP